MSRKLIALLIALILVFTAMPSIASDLPVVYKSSITVTEAGGRYQVGFVNLEFKKEFLEADRLPITFDVELYAENGVVYVEILPDTEDFCKNVHIRVNKYEDQLYDKLKGQNVKVKVKKQQIVTGHFSRYALR